MSSLPAITNNVELIQQLKDYEIIRSQSVAIAMVNTDRRFYAPLNPYVNAPQNIGYGATISAPYMHAFAMEYLRNRMIPGCHVLDIGSGSGYLTACFWRFIQAQKKSDKTKVIGIEHNPALVEISRRNLDADDPEMLKSGTLIIVEGDGRKGYPQFAPYTAIHVGAAAAVTPQALLDQLAKGGRMIIPVGPEGGEQQMTQYDKRHDGTIRETAVMSHVLKIDSIHLSTITGNK
uniref:protein-L-isoaspartate(D-aspartate) O-methyltransferase n=1 Tax=Glossina pallidipes TaxID=7398 RepID=A0A1A9ZRM6_GLOPL